ncbi:DUF3179 domain-containing protein [Halobacteriaceae archaeon GCM10025711]
MNVRNVLPRDAIPSVDDPAFGDAYDGDPDDEVIVVAGDPARAYPVRFLHYHEIVNDVVDGTPVAVTWCPLCGSAVVYDRTVDGRTLTFGVSGKLADDDLVMYDRETGSEWKQSLGECIAGDLSGASLTVLPAAMTTWARFRADHPAGVVLRPPGGASEAASETDDPAPIDYDEEPYRAYFEMDGFGLAAHRGTGGRAWDREDLDPKAVVLGVESGDDALGFPLPRVEDAGGGVEASVGDRSVVVFATSDGIHAFENPGLSFAPDDDGGFRADGARWDGATGESDDGRTLDRVPSKRLFAFAWQDDHGPGSFFG